MNSNHDAIPHLSKRPTPHQIAKAELFSSTNLIDLHRGTPEFAKLFRIKETPESDFMASSKENTKTNELAKIQPNTLYLTFNAPEVDDYHRGLFITPPSPTSIPIKTGTLFHAIYDPPKPGMGTWGRERRPIRDISHAKSLVLLYRISSLRPGTSISDIEAMLNSFSLESRGRRGNPALGGYSCILWVEDALAALFEAGLIFVEGGSVANVMDDARAMAGPEDARKMVGKDFGGVRVWNSN